MVHRFLSGHGPGDERDLLRWANIPHRVASCHRRATRRASWRAPTVRDEAGEEFILHADLTVRLRTTREHAAYLLPTFDEVTLTYARTGVSRSPAPPGPQPTDRRSRRRDGRHRGCRRRTVEAHRPGHRSVSVTIHPERLLTEPERDAVDEAIARLTAFMNEGATVATDGGALRCRTGSRSSAAELSRVEGLQ